jgi:hypothetical protein
MTPVILSSVKETSALTALLLIFQIGIVPFSGLKVKIRLIFPRTARLKSDAKLPNVISFPVVRPILFRYPLLSSSNQSVCVGSPKSEYLLASAGNVLGFKMSAPTRVYLS